MALAIGAAFVRRGFLGDAVTAIEGLPAGWIDAQLRMCETLEWRAASTRARADHDVRRQDAKIAGDVAVNSPSSARNPMTSTLPATKLKTNGSKFVASDSLTDGISARHTAILFQGAPGPVLR